MTYKELTLDKYLKLKEIDTELPEIEYQLEQLSVIYDKPVEELESLPIPEYTKMVRELAFLFEAPNPTGKVPSKINLNGHKYYIMKDVSKFTVAQYTDFQTFYKEYDNYLLNILACFVIPEGKKYCDGYDPVTVVEDLKQMDSLTALNVCFFFRKRFATLIKGGALYLAWKIMRMKRKMSKEQKMMMTEAIGRLRGIATSFPGGAGGTKWIE